jgi:hypothetical protein
MVVFNSCPAVANMQICNQQNSSPLHRVCDLLEADAHAVRGRVSADESKRISHTNNTDDLGSGRRILEELGETVEADLSKLRDTFEVMDSDVTSQAICRCL